MLSSLHDVRLHGQLNFMATIQVAQLVLKHRQNKNQHQRIIFFVGSPLDVSQDDLVRLAKRLRKNNIAVDVCRIIFTPFTPLVKKKLMFLCCQKV